MKIGNPTYICALLGILGCTAQADAASLDAFAGGVGGDAIGSINSGCYTSGTPDELKPFFRGGSFPLGGISPCGLVGGLNQSSSASGTATASLTVPLVKLGGPNNSTAGYYKGQADARASYGSLGVSAQGRFQSGLPAGDPGIYANTVAAAKFTDTLTASSTSIANGTAGYVRYAFELHGSTSALGTPAAYYGGETFIELQYMNSYQPVQYGWNLAIRRGDLGKIQNSTTLPAGWTSTTGTLSGTSTFYSFDLPIVWGQSWDLTVGLVATAYGEATADFLGTAKVTGVQFFDSQHHEVSDFKLLSASGTNYLNLAPVPEPETYAMMLAGLSLIGLLGRRRRKMR